MISLGTQNLVNKIIEHEVRFHLTIISKAWHGFFSLSKIVDGDSVIFMVVNRVRMTLHKIYTQFFKRDENENMI